MEDPGKWQVDKRIPLPAIIAGAFFVIVQTAYISSVLSRYDYRIATLEDYMKASAPQSAEIAVMKEKMTNVQVTLSRIESWFSSLRGGNRPENEHRQ